MTPLVSSPPLPAPVPEASPEAELGPDLVALQGALDDLTRRRLALMCDGADLAPVLEPVPFPAWPGGHGGDAAEAPRGQRGPPTGAKSAGASGAHASPTFRQIGAAKL